MPLYAFMARRRCAHASFHGCPNSANEAGTVWHCGIFDEPVKWDDILDVGQLLTIFLANYFV